MGSVCTWLTLEPTGCSVQRKGGTRFVVHKAEPAFRLHQPLREPLAPAAGSVVPRPQEGLRAGAAPSSWGVSVQEGAGIEEKQVSSPRETGDQEGFLSSEAPVGG